jgi:hypothetical protein
LIIVICSSDKPADELNVKGFDVRGFCDKGFGVDLTNVDALITGSDEFDVTFCSFGLKFFLSDKIVSDIFRPFFFNSKTFSSKLWIFAKASSTWVRNLKKKKKVKKSFYGIFPSVRFLRRF